MWRYPDNNPAKGAAYGKIFNGYAARMLEINPIKGYRICNKTELVQLATTLGGASVAGGKMKVAGLTFWTTPNTGATNESGVSAIGGGFRYIEGSFLYNNTESHYNIIEGEYTNPIISFDTLYFLAINETIPYL
jgi:hypothetical protein